MSSQSNPKIYFSEVFEIEHSLLENYGALDISLVCDNPAFVDPFLIFANPKYKNLHNFIIEYLKYLKKLSVESEKEELDSGIFNHYYRFPEVKQVWLGYTASGNSGLGLGKDFAQSLHKNLHKIFSKFGEEKITESPHLEKLCLVEEGIGVDKISDFTLNLIKRFLLEYTQEFAKKKIDSKYLLEFSVDKVVFDFEKGLWLGARYLLPSTTINGRKQFILLTPREILAKENTWISKSDFLNEDTRIFTNIPNEELRTKINKFFLDSLLTKLDKKKNLIKDYSKKSKTEALLKTVQQYPEVLDYYIKNKEQKKSEALSTHIAKPEIVNFYHDANSIQEELSNKSFGRMDSFDDCVSRIVFFKRILESNSKDLYFKDEPLQENNMRLMFKNVTYGSLFDYNSEVNNGRGPIDFIISYGSQDKTGLELKLASNTKLKKNLLNQGRVYQEDSNLKHVIKIIFFFSDSDQSRVEKILKDTNKVADDRELFLIDCRKKISGSNA